MLRRSVPYLLLAVLCGFLFFWRLGVAPLIGLDEGLYCECSREMLASGNYVAPMCNGLPFYDKPPMAYWLQASSMRVFGVNSFAARLPSAIEELLLVGLTVLLGTRIFSRRAGLLAGFALASSLLAAGLARMAVLDAAFSLMITASLGAFLLAYLKLARKWTYLAFWAAMGLSVMVKGPAGAVLIASIVLIFLAIRRDLKAITNTMPIAGVLTFLAVAMPWYVLVQLQTHGAFLREFLIHQNLQRALGKDFQHNMPFFFYVPVYLIGFFPWSMFVPAALREPDDAKDSTRAAKLFLTVWICTIFVIFSIFRSKLPAYIFPIYPASAILVGQLWDRSMETRICDALRKSTLAALIAACLIGSGIVAASARLNESTPGLTSVLLPMAAALVLGCGVGCALLHFKRYGGAFAGLCCGMSAFIAIAAGVGLPVVARQNAVPAMEMGRIIGKRSEPAFALRLSPPQPQLGFYSGRPVAMVSGSTDIMSRTPCLVVVQDDGRFQPPAGGRVQSKIGPYILLSYSSNK